MNSLALSSPAFDYSALDRANISEGTKTKYKSAIQRLVDAQIDPFNNFTALADYANSLPHSIRAHTKAALAIMVEEYENMIKADLEMEVPAIQRILWKLEAMDNAIQVQKPKGKEMSTWLSKAQVEQITSMPDRSTIIGRRDWIILSVLLGAGLRRSEMAALTLAQIKHQPTKDGMRAVLAITGKGKKHRTVPISPKLEKYLKEWEQEIGGGRVARAVRKNGAIADGLTPESINAIVARYGAMIDMPDLEAHDCRRTWAQLGYNAGIPITQISVLLGHSSVKITQDYLDLNVDLDMTISDVIPLSGD